MKETIGRIAAPPFGIIVLSILYALTAFPQITNAVQSEADAMCNPVIVDQCGCGTFFIPKQGCVGTPNMHLCPCSDKTSGMTAASGKCIAPNKCLADQAGGMMPMLPMIPMMMPMMMMPMMPDPCAQAGTSASSASTSSSTPQTGGCGVGAFDFGNSGAFDYSAYFDTSSSSSDVDSSLFNSLNSSGGGISDFLASTTVKAAETKPTTVVPTTTATLISGLFGDIKLGGSGATIIANLRQGATEVAGFFGGNTFGTIAVPSIAGRICAVRPWASGIVSNLISPAFFDGLCRLSGYQVGEITPTGGGLPTPVSTKPKSQGSQTILPKPTISGEPSADIWAEPPSVRLGTRTYIFWKSTGVLDCKISGPNFSQNALSGGASTVPLSGASTFSIECTAPNGTKVSDSVTVELAI